jgi:hypothetical protein
MSSNQEKNQAAFQEVNQELRNLYPAGCCVAFDEGRIVADADRFDELTEALAAIGKSRPDVFVAPAGVSYPDKVFICPQGNGGV